LLPSSQISGPGLAGVKDDNRRRTLEDIREALRRPP
jgi:hypothetical protein